MALQRLQQDAARGVLLRWRQHARHMVEDADRRQRAQPFLPSLADKMVELERPALSAALARAVQTAGFDGRLANADQAQMCQRAFGAASVQHWLCEERKLQKQSPATYKGDGSAANWML